jgi:aryl-alcohol dehydrogenase-like predicted oxidoreductase
MELRSLGRTDVKITPLGLGCWQFSQGKGLISQFWPVLETKVMDEIVKTALEGGINWFDTAEVYGGGNSERALAGALSRRSVKPGQAIVATKWWPLFRTAGSIGRTFPKREAALSPYAIDLLQIHQPTSLSSVEKQARALAALLRAGHIRAAGVSNFTAEAMKTAARVLQEEGFSLASNQMRYSLVDRSIESNGVLAAARELGVSIIAYSPLAQGLLSGKFHDDPAALASASWMRRTYTGINPEGIRRTEPLVRFLQETGKKYGVSASQVALNWLVTFHGETVVAIPGATKVKHAQEASGALAFTLTPGEREQIDHLSAAGKV